MKIFDNIQIKINYKDTTIESIKYINMYCKIIDIINQQYTKPSAHAWDSFKLQTSFLHLYFCPILYSQIIIIKIILY